MGTDKNPFLAEAARCLFRFLFPSETGEESFVPQTGQPQFISYRMKFMLYFSLLITIPMLFVGLLLYDKYSANAERQAEQYTYQLADQIRLNLDRYVKEIERLTMTPFYDPEVLDILQTHSDPHQKGIYLTTEEERKMNLFISSMVFERSEIESILIFTNDGSVFSNFSVNVMNYWVKEKEDWMSRVSAYDGGLAVLSPHTVHYYTTGPKQVVSLSRLIREPFTHKIFGVIKVDLSVSGFEKIFSPSIFGNNSKLYIYNRDGERVYPFEPDTAPDWNDPNYVDGSVTSEYTGLRVIAQVPLEELQQDARALTDYTLFIAGIAMALALLLAMIASSRLVKPIRHLQSKMALVQKGFFKEQAEVMTHDEVGQLTEGFNKMVREIDRLIREVYETRLREREAELSALQSQMNPHFLYNTLESVNMMAVRHKAPDISIVVSNLGKLLRYTVDNRQMTARLRDEIQFVESYLHILAMRNGDRLRIEIYVDASLQNALVPKLILQPLVENAIEHGMRHGGSEIKIRLRAKLAGDDLLLFVEDDGEGMDERTVCLVERRMFAPREEEKAGFGQKRRGFALRNVHQRIRLLYGEPYGIAIVRESAEGASFQIRMPFRWEE